MQKVRLRAEAYPEQADFIEDTHLYSAFIGGTGSGKTYAGALKAEAQVFPLREHTLGMVVAPTYPMLHDATWRTCLAVWAPLITNVNRSAMQITVGGRHEVLFRSADEPDRLRGPNLHWAWIDEAEYCKEDTWRILIARLRAEGRMGRIWVTSTPNYKNPWLDEAFPLDNSLPDRIRIRVSTFKNIFLPRAFAQQLAAQYTSEFARQEIYGERIQLSAGMFQRHWFTIVDHAPEGLRWARYWDLAASTQTTGDYTASCAVALGSDGVLYICDLVRGRWEWPEARRIIIQTMLAEPQVEHGIEEALHGLAAVQELRREPSLARITIRGIRVERDKVTRAMPWAARAEAGKVALVRGNWIPAFLDEVVAFPEGAHDDMVDSVSGGVAMLGQGYGPNLRWL
jgi:predicted phage terminase large subunit-like protein